MPNDTQPIVPGTTPGTTPPFLPAQGQAPDTSAGGVSDMAKKMLTRLLQASQQKKFAGTPHPTSLPGSSDPFSPPAHMIQGPNPNAWSKQRFMYGVQSMIKNAVSKEKENKITKAMADWEYLQSGLNEYYAAQSSGDQQGMASAQKKLDVILGDPKKLKAMAKSLNQDWLNPEKTTEHGEALKRVTAETEQKEGKKNQARTGITNMFKSLLHRQQQPQYTDDEKKKIGQEVMSKAPTTTGAFDPSVIKDVAALEKAITDSKEKYAYVTDMSTGHVLATNKSDPKDTHELRDVETGNAITGKTAPKENTLYMVNGMPLGVFHGGKPVMPGDPGWNEKDQKMFDASMEAAKEKRNLKVAPEIAAMVGEPPNPSDFKKGRSDPEYAAELKMWGKKVFDKELEKAAVSGEARAKAMNEYRPVQVMNAEGEVYYTTAKDAISQGLSGASEGVRLKPREAQIKDIQVASKMTRDAIKGLGTEKFSAAQIAKLNYALSTEDESLSHTELAALASEDLTEKQQDFVIWVRQLNERAMSLRNVAGMGTGAQDLRSAIRAMIPGIRSGSTQMMNKQLDAFDNQVKILKEGIAHPGKTGKVKMKAPNGEIKEVPQDQVEHYKGLGASIVQ